MASFCKMRFGNLSESLLEKFAYSFFIVTGPTNPAGNNLLSAFHLQTVAEACCLLLGYLSPTRRFHHVFTTSTSILLVPFTRKSEISME